MVVSLSTLVALSLLYWFEFPRVHLSTHLQTYLRPVDIRAFRERSSAPTFAWLLDMVELGHVRMEHDADAPLSATPTGQWYLQDRHVLEHVPEHTLPNATLCTMPVATDTHPQFWIVEGSRRHLPQTLPTLEDAWRIAVWMQQPDSHWWIVYRDARMASSPSPKRLQDECWPTESCTFVYDPRARNQRVEIPAHGLSLLVQELMTGQLYVCKSN
jgi:hypothetical protein